MQVINRLRHSLIFKLILGVGLTLLVSISVWAYFNIEYQRGKLMQHILKETWRLGNTIKLGMNAAMMHNSRDDINQIIQSIARQEEIDAIRIYNKSGQIKFSNRLAELEEITNIKAEACDVCHRFDPPIYELELEKMIRVLDPNDGSRKIGIIMPILNEAGCSTDACHVHPADKKVLGALDILFSLQATDQEIFTYERGLIYLAVIMFLVTSTAIAVIMFTFVNQPIRQLIRDTRSIAKGDFEIGAQRPRDDEIGELSTAFQQMGREISETHAELKRQRNEFQTLFEMVPCDITVHDREYRLISYNKRFAEKFNPTRGDYCYQVYKGRDTRCHVCPVEKTFRDGQPHMGEEAGINKFGQILHWLVFTSPLTDADGRISAVMEMNLDMTKLKSLEEKLKRSEKKYRTFFNNIPNPVFVLDAADLHILDCNNSVKPVYGYEKSDIVGMSFLTVFQEQTEEMAATLRTHQELNQVRHIRQDDTPFYVNIRISPFESDSRKGYLVTTSDITKRMEVEQQLIQACKMATMGEMATGVAHELNQPLSVLKTACSYFMKKVTHHEPIADDILNTMATEMDSHIRRATRIINHMREFGHKSDLETCAIHLNAVIQRAFEIFSQQLKVRGIEVVWELEPELPVIKADAGRLEQVFINLLVNARDAIEAADQMAVPAGGTGMRMAKQIRIHTRSDAGQVIAEVSDTGMGVPPEIRDKIFEPFFTTKEVGKGTGLGLSISYSIIKDCGGVIQVLPRETGACFAMTFPVWQDDTERIRDTG